MRMTTLERDLLIINRFVLEYVFISQKYVYQQRLCEIQVNTKTHIWSISPFFVMSDIMMNFPILLPMWARILWSQYFWGREYNLIHIGKKDKYSSSRLNLGTHGFINKPAKFIKYGRPWKIRSKSSILLKITIQKPLDHSLNFASPLIV